MSDYVVREALYLIALAFALAILIAVITERIWK